MDNQEWLVLFRLFLALVICYGVAKFTKSKYNSKIKKTLKSEHKSQTWILVLALISVIILALVVVYYSEEPEYYTSEQTLAVEQPQTLPTSYKPVEAPTVARLLELTNAERAKAGVAPLELDERLNQSAQKKADEIVATGIYEHEDANGTVTAFKDIPRYMKECMWYSENLNNNSIDVIATVQSWMGSQSHRNAILDKRYEYTGFGINLGYVVQHFCDVTL